MDQDDVELELCDEYRAWCDENGFKESDHDELLQTEGLTDDQYCWLTAYSQRWNEMINSMQYA